MPVNFGPSTRQPLGEPVLLTNTAPLPSIDHAASMSVAVATLDARGNIIAAGGALAELVDTTIGELMEREFASLFTVDNAAPLFLAIDRCRSGIASWVAVRLARQATAPMWVRLEPLVATASGSALRIGVAVLRTSASWRPANPVEIPLPLRTAIDDLRAGLEQQQFQLRYQPIIDLRRPRIVGVEALLRWQHPQAGLLLPAQFLPIAEAAGLTEDITAYVVREACTQAARWPDWRVAVNLFPADLQSTSIVDQVTEALNATSLPAHRLSLEVTEESLGDPVKETLSVLKDLQKLGVRLSLDDFSTGHSSLLHLRDFPVTELKIGREFVAGLTRGGDESAIVRSVVSLAGTLGLGIVAVGVHTTAQLIELQLLGCDFGQGFLFSSPVSTEQVEALYTDPRAFLAKPPE